MTNNENWYKDIVELLLDHGAEMDDLLLADPNINVGCIKIGLLKNVKSREKFQQKFQQDYSLFKKIEEAAEEVKNEGELGESLKKRAEGFTESKR